MGQLAIIDMYKLWDDLKEAIHLLQEEINELED